MEKIGFILMVLWILLCVPFYMATDSILLGILIGTLVSVGIGVSIWKFTDGLSEIEKYKTAKANKYHSLHRYVSDIFKDIIKKFSISAVCILLTIVIGIVTFSFGNGDGNHKVFDSDECGYCGSSPIYKGSGLCENCYNNMKQSQDALDK